MKFLISFFQNLHFYEWPLKYRVRKKKIELNISIHKRSYNSGKQKYIV